MKKVFIDANIIVSVLNKEYPGFRAASRVLSLADYKGFALYTSATCLAIAFYFASKKCGEEKAKAKIKILCEKLKICPTGAEEVSATLQNAAVRDLEDGIQYYAAISSGCTYIVSEDTDDFYFSAIPVMNSENFLREIALPALQRPY